MILSSDWLNFKNCGGFSHKPCKKLPSLRNDTAKLDVERFYTNAFSEVGRGWGILNPRILANLNTLGLDRSKFEFCRLKTGCIHPELGCDANVKANIN